MPAVTLRLPFGLTYPERQKEVRCEGETVGDALHDLLRREPRLSPRVFLDEDKLIVSIFLNGRSVRDLGGLDTPVAEGDKLLLVPPLGGG